MQKNNSNESSQNEPQWYNKFFTFLTPRQDETEDGKTQSVSMGDDSSRNPFTQEATVGTQRLEIECEYCKKKIWSNELDVHENEC